MQTRPDRRRQKLATAVLTELIRELEAENRLLVLRVRPDNEAAIRLYARFGFRGRTRVAQFGFTASVSLPER
jgi:ribosomal protein S18 acetylase RimI-like enzyme